MSWRIVVISNRAKLDLQLNYLVIRNEELNKIFLNEISTLIIESTAVSMTAALLNELIKRKIKVIFCDEKRNPSSELLPYYGSHDSSNKIRKQIEWSQNIKDLVWTEIVSEKIKKQRDLLKKVEKEEESRLLSSYIDEIQLKDSTNREGHAAKVYFNALFGLQFTRAADVPTNAALNYGYALLASAFNREIVANGYLTQLGIFHDNMFNQFNFAYDLIEPYRPLVDAKVFSMNPIKFDSEEKVQLLSILNSEIHIDGKNHYVNNGIRIYCKSVLDAINDEDISKICFYSNEL